jgi:hypothetical protein
MIDLSDDGPLPKFGNQETFSIEIIYVPMPEEELKEVLELQEFEESASNSEGDSSS